MYYNNSYYKLYSLLVFSMNCEQEQYIKIEEHSFKRMSQFEYLGLIITQDNDIKTEVS